jgi:hypothetical protein
MAEYRRRNGRERRWGCAPWEVETGGVAPVGLYRRTRRLCIEQVSTDGMDAEGAALGFRRAPSLTKVRRSFAARRRLKAAVRSEQCLTLIRRCWRGQLQPPGLGRGGRVPRTERGDAPWRGKTARSKASKARGGDATKKYGAPGSSRLRQESEASGALMSVKGESGCQTGPQGEPCAGGWCVGVGVGVGLGLGLGLV